MPRKVWRRLPGAVRRGTLSPMAEFDELRGEEWRRLLAAARRRLDKTGGEVTGSVALADPSAEELRSSSGSAAAPPTTQTRPARRPSRWILPPPTRPARGVPRGLVRRWPGSIGPAARRHTEALEAAMRCRHAGRAGSPAGSVGSPATVGQAPCPAGDGDLLGWAAAVLDRLPARDVPLPVLAEWATGDPTALSGKPLAGLGDAGAGPLAGRSAPRPAGTAERRVWGDAGVLADDLFSQVLVLGLRARESTIVGSWLDEAASAGMPFRLTLQQLVTATGLAAARPDLRLARARSCSARRRPSWGPGCAALVCTEGRLSAACDRLLRAAAGATIRWRNDFDWPGLRMTAAATERYGAAPWHMSTDDYLDALGTGGEDPLEGTRTAAPWDSRLATTMAREHRAAREEWLLPALLADLHQAT